MTPGFSRLSVTGYRRLREVNLPLRPLNVLIGANGVGKSSILDVLSLLAASASGKLAAKISELGGMASILTADGVTDAMFFQLMTSTNSLFPLDYFLSLTKQAYGYAIDDEILRDLDQDPIKNPKIYLSSSSGVTEYFQRGRMIEPDWQFKDLETALSQAPKMRGAADGFRDLVAGISDIYHGLDVSVRAPVRQPQTLLPAQTPGLNGEDLVSCLFTISQTQKDRFEAIEDSLRAAFPAFQRLDFPPVAAGRITLAWQESGFSRPFYPHELSEGTLRFLWLATLLQSPGLSQVTLIDEPEVSLHPEMLRLLADLMRESSQRTQLIVATHSDRFVRFLEPSELVVCDKDETGGMTAQWADQLDLKDWLEDYTLDQLWSKGIIGGRA